MEGTVDRWSRNWRWTCLGKVEVEALEYVERYTPFTGSWVVWYTEGIRAADIFDDDVRVGESDVVSRDDDVVDAN